MSFFVKLVGIKAKLMLFLITDCCEYSIFKFNIYIYNQKVVWQDQSK